VILGKKSRLSDREIRKTKFFLRGEELAVVKRTFKNAEEEHV
jgi:hypothetical protein